MVDQIKSFERVQKFGEVNTPLDQVNAMLDLVEFETKRLDSRFLEPACGDGNFLSVILSKKLKILLQRYEQNKYEFEKNSIVVFTSIYGIDLLEDNIKKTRKRLFEMFDLIYRKNFNNDYNQNLKSSIKFILNKNIIHGDALTLKKLNSEDLITFSEWSLINNKIKRRDFTFNELVAYSPFSEGTLFSDLGNDVFIPKPIAEFPTINFDRVFEYDI